MNIHEMWLKKTEEGTDKGYFDTYIEKEREAYASILASGKKNLRGTSSELAKKFVMDITVFAGFLDGINTSLEVPLELEKLTESSEISIDIDFEKLYYNMHAAKANWLYLLKEWDEVLTIEKRQEISKQFNRDNTAVSEKVGRNEPCPCGSGKKYKKCCGKIN